MTHEPPEVRTAQPIHVRIFLSSPDDVAEERRIAHKVIGEVARGALVRGQVTIEVVAYDDPAAPAPMSAVETPQISVSRYSGRPADCDLTVVILWSKLGTALPEQVRREDGTRYESGTVWELEDARSAQREAWVYRRTEEPVIKLTDPKLDQRRAALVAVNEFFQQFTNPDGSLSSGFNQYPTPTEFEPLLKGHLEALIRSRVDLARQAGAFAQMQPAATVSTEPPVGIPCQLPDRSLAGELFGRQQECRELAALLHTGGTVYVQGPAGFGKTALAAEVVSAMVGDDEASLKASPFPDGVVLLNLYDLKGRSTEAWNKLADALIGNRDAHLPAEQRATQACRNRRMLLIVEGAEEADGCEGRCHINELLKVCDPLNRRLILTRDLSQTIPIRTVGVNKRLSSKAAEQLFDRIAKDKEKIHPEIRREALAMLQGHPLALTWAGSLLTGMGENPRQILRDWSASGWTNLSDPEQAEHTLRWLFERSVRRLNAQERTVLTAAGLLTQTEIALQAMAAALGDEGNPRSALKRLVQLGILQLSSDQNDPEKDRWHFIHVLGYQFARETAEDSAVLRKRLAQWAGAEISDSLVRADIARLQVVLSQARAVLAMDDEQAQSALANYCLYEVVDRATELGQLSAVDLALQTVADWMDKLPAHKSQEGFWQRERSVLRNRRGDLQQAQGDLAGALNSYMASNEIAKGLVRADPTNVQWQRNLSVNQNRLGDLQKAQGALAAALSSYLAGKDIAEILAQATPTHTEAQRDLGISHEKLGDLQYTQGDLAAALSSYTASREIRERLVQADPTNTRWQRDLSISHEKLGDLQQAQDDLAAALSSYTTSREIRERLAHADPTNAQWQRDLSVNQNKLGELQQAQGDLTAALGSYTASREIRERLARADPTNAQWQRDLSVSHEKLGSLQQAHGDLAGALSSHTTSLEIRERLARADPTNAQWQRDLSYSLTVLAQVKEKGGLLSEALEHAEVSLAIDERLARLDSSNVVWQEDVVVSRGLVTRLRSLIKDRSLTQPAPSPAP